jgi:hypothetical protein
MRLLLYLFLVIALVACASVSMPTGGPKDDIPPKLIASTPDSAQLNFFSRKIQLQFDENVKLSNLKKELIVSPPIGDYDVKNSEDKIELIFDAYPEVNTTYTLNFGNAIQDVNESNTLSNFMLVFSTGNEIDTGTISGMALNQYTQEPEKESLVLLYQHTGDSNFLFGNPYYMTKTDEDGHFQFFHLAEGHYDLILLNDQNGNRKLDSDEFFAFYPDSVPVNKDSLILKTSQYQEDIPLKGRIISSKNAHDYSIAFNKTLDLSKILNFVSEPPMSFSSKKSSLPYRLNSSGDSLHFYYKPDQPLDSFLISFEYNSDTLSLLSKTQSGGKTSSIKCLDLNIQTNPGDSVTIRFNHPIESIRKTGFRIFNISDSIYEKNFELKQHEDFTATILHPWKSTKAYELTFDSASIRGYDTLLSKMIKIKLTTKNAENLSSFSFTPVLDSSFTDTTPIYAVLYTKTTEFQPRRIVSSKPIQYKHINPGTYRVKFFLDQNGDGEWTPANPFPRKSGEPVLFHPSTYELKANWIAEDNVINIHNKLNIN